MDSPLQIFNNADLTAKVNSLFMNVTEINQRIDQIERLSPAERMK